MEFRRKLCSLWNAAILLGVTPAAAQGWQGRRRLARSDIVVEAIKDPAVGRHLPRLVFERGVVDRLQKAAVRIPPIVRFS